MELKEFFKENPKAAIGFSGGVDSAYLLYAAKMCGADVQPYYIKTSFQPQFEYEAAMRFSKELGVNLKVSEYDILSDKTIAENPKNRCYYCKKALFSLLRKNAEADGYRVVLDGTNASDDIEERAGWKAIKELSVRSPLRECGLTKDRIRLLSKEAGLFTWDKPAYACLATRIPTGDVITEALVRRVEMAENALASMGFSDFRVRIYHGAARLQIKSSRFSDAVRKRVEILKALGVYFDNIFLDFNVR